MKNNKGMGMLILMVTVAIVLIMATGFYLIKSKKEINLKRQIKEEISLNDYDAEGDDTDDETEIEVTPNPVSSDNSFTTIESEIDETVIVEEDFSDL